MWTEISPIHNDINLEAITSHNPNQPNNFSATTFEKAMELLNKENFTIQVDGKLLYYCRSWQT